MAKIISDIIDDPISEQKIADAINEKIKVKSDSIYNIDDDLKYKKSSKINDSISEASTRDFSCDHLESSVASRLTPIDSEEDESNPKPLIKSEAYSKVIDEMHEKSISLDSNLLYKEEYDKFIKEIHRPKNDLFDSINNKVKQIRKVIKDKISEHEINGIPIKDEDLEEIEKIEDELNLLVKDLWEDFIKSDSLYSLKNQINKSKQIQEFTLSKTLESIKKLY